MQSIIVKGRTTEEAVEKALTTLAAPIEAVTINVLEEAEDRFFGMFVKPAVVEVTIKGGHEQREENTRKEEEEIAGVAWVEDGQVLVRATAEKRPTIFPHDYIRITVNGEEIAEETELTNEDEIELHGKVVSEMPPEFDIKIDREKLSAMLYYEPGYREVAVPVKEVPPERHLIVEAEVTKERIPLKSDADIFAALEQQRVVYGINKEAIKAACASDELQQVEIATGLPAEKGSDGKVDFQIDLEEHQLRPKERPDGTVDFREVRKIPSVEKGQIIGVIVPPQAGKQGRTITGEEIPTNVVREVNVTGNELSVLPDGTIIANKTGTPNVAIRYTNVTINIEDKLTHRGDVDMKSGNLSFVGDVEITGNVEETMNVTAAGKLLIQGSVHGAVVTAKNALVVNNNVVRSKLIIGTTDEDHLLKLKVSEQLLNKLQTIHVSFQQLLRAQRENYEQHHHDVPAIVRLLVLQKFPSLKTEIETYGELLKKGDEKAKETERELFTLLDEAFVQFKRDVLREETVFISVVDSLRSVNATYEEQLHPFATVTMAAAQQAEIYCNGDVYLAGRGAYNTDIEARGNVVVSGLLRGGSIRAEGKIEVNEVGSDLGVETLLAVPKDGHIKIGQAYEETLLQIGKRTYRFDRERRNVFAKIDDSGEIVLM